MLLDLPYEIRKNIYCIIDNNRLCVAGNLGIKVISENEIEANNIEAIVLSSFKHSGSWKKSLFGDYQIIDLYEELKKNGYPCDREYYKKVIKHDDYKW